MSRSALPLLLLCAGLGACRPAQDDSPWGGLGLDLPLWRAPPVAPDRKLSGDLRRALEAGDTEGKLRVMVDLSLQLDLDALGGQLRRSGAGRRDRRDTVVVALGRVAERSQARLQPVLEALRRRGWVETYRGFSIINRLLVVASPEAIRSLAERAEVAAIVEERVDVGPSLAEGRVLADAQPDESWALAAIGAAVGWRQGLDGAGVVVGIIDAGASAAHEQLRGNHRSDDRSWHDPTGNIPTPRDAMTGHGTGVLSAAVGQNVGGRTVGVAPGARWIACVGVPGGRYNNVAMTECADWMLNVGQPDVLINAWLLPEPGCDLSLRRLVDAWRAAEILPVFAAGNHGPAAQTDRSPANYGRLYPGDATAFSVGGLATPESLFVRSSRGPSTCDGSTYPTVVAPAVDVTAAFPLAASTYIRTEGTSVATGLVAGVAAILLQRYPQAAVSDLEAALRSGAVDLGPSGPDNTFGFGRLDLPGALDALGALLEGRARPGARGRKGAAPQQ